MVVLKFHEKPAEFGVGIEIGIEEGTMKFGHEKLDMYRVSLEYVR